MKGEVVTLVTNMQSEIVGKLISKDAEGEFIRLEHPRLFVPAQHDGGNPGFAPGYTMTGVVEPSEGTFNRTGVLSITLTHPDIESAWRQATSGIIT